MVLFVSKAQGQRAFSLIEAAIVLAVVGLVIAAIWVAANSVREKRQINQMVEAVLYMTERLNILYRDTPPTTTADITAQLLLMDVVPKDLVQNGVPTTPWGTAFSFNTEPDVIFLDFSDYLVGKKCRQFLGRLYGAIYYLPTFRSGSLELVVDGDAYTISDDVLTVMNSCSDVQNSGTITRLAIRF